MSVKDKYHVERIPFVDCKEWLLHKHYAKRIPSISYAFGLFDTENILQGVCTFGTPASSTLLFGVCGHEYKEIVIELNRLIVVQNDKNMTSYFVSQCLNIIESPKIIISYADTSKNHNGYIYQATNFLYTGLSSKFVDPKVRGLEHQHHATYANGKSNEDLKIIYGDRLYFEDRPRKHRYIYFIGSKKEKKEMLKALKYEIQPYPKGENKNYDASYQPTIQGKMF